jgi:hypothetical protein
MNSTFYADLITGLKNGSIVPYLGPGVLRDVRNVVTDELIPAASDSLILAMNGGRPMAPKLMYEFPRAAMNQELKKGRKFVEKFLTEIYAKQQWHRSALHDWLAELAPDYVIDINRDTQLQESFKNKPHTLIVGAARISGTDYRYQLYQYNGNEYSNVKNQFGADASPDLHTLPILFKPMGTPLPQPSYVASDADYVDYITELMGGFAIPSFVKDYRKDRQYLLLGMRLGRDTERMVLSDMIYASAKAAGWAFIPNPTNKEQRFCENRNIEIVEADWDDLIGYSDTSRENVA